jgi:DNA-binding PadR family transcriptional regulator
VAQRRKVGNMLGLAVLSAVAGRPMHPYEMASVLRARGKDDDMKLKWGSLYTVVGNLEKHGFIEAVESGRQGGRPERTVYRITDAGYGEMADWVRELIGVPEPEFPRFKAGLSVMGVLSPDEVTALLLERIALLEKRVAHLRATLAEHGDVPRVFLIETEYDLAMHEAEAAWVRAMLAEFTDGSLPGLAEWREFHRTGAVPPELADLAERGATKD